MLFDYYCLERVEMKPYYETELGRLYHGDCLEVMPELEPVDLVLADPTYGMNANVKTESTKRTHRPVKGFDGSGKDWPAVKGDDKPFDPKPFLGFKEVILWGGNHYASRLPDSRAWLVWDKRCGRNSDNNSDCEIAWSNIGGAARLYHHYWRGWIRAGEENLSRNGKKLHPFQKPISLISWCLYLSKTNGTVLDPFIGSGTTAVACERINRKWIGIEISEKYCEIAAKRIESERKQLSPWSVVA